MRKIHMLGLTLFAVFAFSAFVASTASAALPEILCVKDSVNVEPKWTTEALCLAKGASEPAGEWALGWEWLVEGAAVTEELPAETEGELTLVQFAAEKSTTVLLEIKCSGIFDGFIGPGRLDLVTDLLNLNMEEIGELGMPANEKPLECTVTKEEGAVTDCKENTTALVWPEHLNLELALTWTSEVVQVTATTAEDVFKGQAGVNKEPGYEVECESLFAGIKGENKCEGTHNVAMVTNEATTPASVFGVFEKVTIPQRGECTTGGKEVAENVGNGHTWAIGAELERLETALS